MIEGGLYQHTKMDIPGTILEQEKVFGGLQDSKWGEVPFKTK